MQSVRQRHMTRELSVLLRRRGGCESAQHIVNVAATAEALAVTALGEALKSAASGGLALDSDQQQSLRASRAEEHAHYKFFGLSCPFGGDSSVRKVDLDPGAAEVHHRDERVC